MIQECWVPWAENCIPGTIERSIFSAQCWFIYLFLYLFMPWLGRKWKHPFTATLKLYCKQALGYHFKNPNNHKNRQKTLLYKFMNTWLLFFFFSNLCSFHILIMIMSFFSTNEGHETFLRIFENKSGVKWIRPTHKLEFGFRSDVGLHHSVVVQIHMVA